MSKSDNSQLFTAPDGLCELAFSGVCLTALSWHGCFSDGSFDGVRTGLTAAGLGACVLVHGARGCCPHGRVAELDPAVVDNGLLGTRTAPDDVRADLIAPAVAGRCAIDELIFGGDLFSLFTAIAVAGRCIILFSARKHNLHQEIAL